MLLYIDDRKEEQEVIFPSVMDKEMELRSLYLIKLR